MRPITNLYIHVPFCLELCSYCDFKKDLYSESKADQFLILLDKEFRARKENWNLETIYIGGGTPSALSIQQTKDLMLTVKHYVQEFKIKEYTIEANPEDVTLEKVNLWKKYGVNRVSLGVQSFNNKLLKILERRHNSARVFEAFATIKKAGIDNISIDLIFNLPTQTMENIYKDLEQVQTLNPSHISWYSLVIKEESKLRNHVIDLEKEADYMEVVQNGLREQGFEQYEISNFTKEPSLRSLHNIAYWKSNNWVGLGWGASSFVEGITTVNIGEVNNFKGEITKNSQEEVMEQVVMMALRYIEGLDLTNLLHKKAYDYFKKGIQKELEKGTLVQNLNNISVIKEKWMLLDSVLVNIFTYE